MMCLPSIARLHDSREAARKELAKSKMLTCDCCCEEFPKDAPGAVKEEYWSPLIKDKPSGLIFICPKCREENEENYGNSYGEDSYFECEDCGKVHVVNYSWELYRVITEDGESICMACAAERELDESSERWLTSEEAIRRATESTEALQAYGPKHLSCIGGDKSYPHGVTSFRETPEYAAEKMDWFNRMEMGGYGGDNTEEVRDCALAAFKFYERVYITIAEAGQFQVYLDILVDTSSRRPKQRKTRKPKTDLKRAKSLPAGVLPDPITRI